MLTSTKLWNGPNNQAYERSSILLKYPSLYNPLPWTNGGRPSAFAGFGAAENKGIAFGPQYSHTLLLDCGGIASGAPIAVGTFYMIPTSYGIPSLSP